MTTNRRYNGPLHGVTIVDLTQMLAGPFCTMLLADLGADVIKIEPPQGDMTRSSAPFRPDDEFRAFGGYFASVNRNKRSMVVDLKNPAGLELLLDLLDAADVVVENSRTGVMERLGLGYEVLRERNPKLIYGSIRGYGDPRFGESPYANWPAFDVTAQAHGGFMGITGDHEPMKAGPGVGDIFPASLAALGIVSAVRHAELTGQGQYVDVAMYDGVLALCERIVHQYSFEGTVPGPQGNTHPLLAPFDIFETSEGFVSIAAPHDRHWEALCHAMGRPDCISHEDFVDSGTRARNAKIVRELVTSWTRDLTKDQVLEAIGGKVPVGPVNTVEDIFADPHVHVRNMLAEVDHPGVVDPVTIVGVPIKLSETPGGVRTRAPMLGEHTDTILVDFGYDTERIQQLRASDAIA